MTARSTGSIRRQGIRTPAVSDQVSGVEASLDPRERVLGYASVDTEHPEVASLELRRQAHEIASECERRGIFLVDVIYEDVSRGRRALERPGLGYALERIAESEADGLVVSELHRIGPALPQVGLVLEWLTTRGARFVSAGAGIDTGEAAGQLSVRTIIEVSRWERQRLAERTRKGMRAARSKGPARVADRPELTQRIKEMRMTGMTLQAIADQLNADGIPTVRGGLKWRPSSVQSAAGYERPAVRERRDAPRAMAGYLDGEDQAGRGNT
jgi:DNA invertase Pin-like site-specific DNA recombinase